jgi:hypothetical protein
VAAVRNSRSAASTRRATQTWPGKSGTQQTLSSARRGSKNKRRSVPKPGKKALTLMLKARNQLKRKVQNPTDEPWIQDNQAHWKDELRVLENKLRDAGVRIRVTKTVRKQAPLKAHKRTAKQKGSETVKKGRGKNGK